MATTKFTLTQAAGTSTKKLTISLWFKLGTVGGNSGLWSCGTGTGDAVGLAIRGDYKIIYNSYSAPTGNPMILAAQLLRDPGAWYHVVASEDTTNVTGGDRMKMYLNGTEVTAFTTDTNPTQDSDIPGWSGSGDVMEIGNRILDGDGFFDGTLAHVHVIDGTIYAASAFGEFDSTSGIWVPNSAPSVTYGTNGGFYKFTPGALTTDSSGESNTLTQVGTPIATKDNARDNYCTWNPVGNPRMSGATVYPVTFSNGNTTATNGDGSYYSSSGATMGVQKGKWYAEAKCSAVGGPEAYFGLIADDDYGIIADTYTYQQNGNVNGSAYGNTYTTGDIISLAFDGDNGTLWFGKNGTWENGATEGEIEAGTDTNAAVTSMGMTKSYLLGQKGYNSGVWQLNTGNGYFGTTAITSAGTNAGSGLFEYDVPSGYYAFNTNNLATYG